MLNLIPLGKKRVNELKEKVLRNKEAVLDIMSRNIKGARQCPFLGGEKCIGQFCEHFMQFYTLDTITKETKEYWRCAHVQVPHLIIELNQSIKALTKLLNERKGGE